MITFDILGTICTDVVTSPSGDVLAGGEPLPGYHINTIPEVPGWEPYRVRPMSKRRVFAGLAAETVCYLFPDEATFLAACADGGIPLP